MRKSDYPFVAGDRSLRQVNGEDHVATYAAAGKLPGIVEAFEQAKKASRKAELVALINDCNPPREAIPPQWLNEAVGSVYAGLSRGDERSRFSGICATLTGNQSGGGIWRARHPRKGRRDC